MSRTRPLQSISCIMVFLVLGICVSGPSVFSADENPNRVTVRNWSNPKDPEVIAHLKPEDISDFCRRLEFAGTALAEEENHFWGASPIWGPDGKVHLFATRWPIDKSKGWGNGFVGVYYKSVLAHYVADRPEGPFTFSDVALTAGGDKSWDSLCVVNPDIKKVGDRYVLGYAGASEKGLWEIGMAVSKSLYGPWKRIGKDGLAAADV